MPYWCTRTPPTTTPPTTNGPRKSFTTERRPTWNQPCATFFYLVTSRLCRKRAIAAIFWLYIVSHRLKECYTLRYIFCRPMTTVGKRTLLTRLKFKVRLLGVFWRRGVEICSVYETQEPPGVETWKSVGLMMVYRYRDVVMVPLFTFNSILLY